MSVSFRTAKYLRDEWFQNSYARYHQAFADRDYSERQRHESGQLVAETGALAQRTQLDSTRKVGERLEDMHCWKSELQREIDELSSETDLMMAQKLRLQRALDATSVPYSIATDNLLRAERERLASVNLRKLIDCILRDTAEDLRLQCDAVNSAFSSRCQELDDSLQKLQYHLRKTLTEITDQEHQIAALKQAIKDKEAPLRVAQTRLYQRSHRPNVELCRDNAQFSLLSEVEELNMSLRALKEKLQDAEQALRNLEDSRMSLEKDIAVKTNSLFIDRQKCMTHRNRYPSVLQLAGYQ